MRATEQLGVDQNFIVPVDSENREGRRLAAGTDTVIPREKDKSHGHGNSCCPAKTLLLASYEVIGESGAQGMVRYAIWQNTIRDPMVIHPELTIHH